MTVVEVCIPEYLDKKVGNEGKTTWERWSKVCNVSWIGSWINYEPCQRHTILKERPIFFIRASNTSNDFRGIKIRRSFSKKYLMCLWTKTTLALSDRIRWHGNSRYGCRLKARDRCYTKQFFHTLKREVHKRIFRGTNGTDDRLTDLKKHLTSNYKLH